MLGGDTDISITVDGGKHYQAKVEAFLQSLANTSSNPHTPLQPQAVPQPPVLPVTGWKPFPSQTIPSQFCYGTIYQHIISSAKLVNADSDDGDDDGENTADFGTAKPMRKGRYYFTSGHVTDIHDNSNAEFYFLKSVVRASYKQQQYHVSLTLSKYNCKVVDSSCECKASAMGRCSHVAGLLFALEDYTIMFGYTPSSCTSKLCQWNVGRKQKNNPQPAHVEQYKKKNEPNRIIDYDPRPIESTNNDVGKKIANNFVAHLAVLSGKTVFSTLIESGKGSHLSGQHHWAE